jgi:hypothetical protein
MKRFRAYPSIFYARSTFTFQVELSLLPVLVTCTCYLYLLSVLVTCTCYLYLLPVLVTCTYYLYVAMPVMKYFA